MSYNIKRNVERLKIAVAKKQFSGLFPVFSVSKVELKINFEHILVYNKGICKRRLERCNAHLFPPKRRYVWMYSCQSGICVYV